MKKSYIVLIVLAVVAVVLFLVYGKGGAQGKVVFAVTDATAEIKNISSINITINEISVHSEGSGWVVVSTATKEFDLLKLKSEGALELAAQSNLKAGTYDQIRLNISKVVVVKEGQSIEAKLPSNKMTLTGSLVVNADTTSTITFDFLADKSLHMTGNDKFILVPVVRLETKSGADVSFEGKKVKISGGKIEHENTEGMDENGKVGKMFDDNDELDEIDGVIKVRSSGENEAVVKITAREAIDKGTVSGLTTILSLRLKTENGQTLWKVTGLQNLEMKTVYINAMTGLVVSVKDNDDDKDKNKDDKNKGDDNDGKNENKNSGEDNDKNDDNKGNDDNKDSSKDGEVKLNLSSQNNSGIAGTVKLENKDGKVEVKLNLIGVSTGVTGLLGISLGATHPAHIHSGSCANIGAVKYPLTSTVNGESETKINASFADLKAQLPLAVNAHKSLEEIGVYVACVDIKF